MWFIIALGCFVWALIERKEKQRWHRAWENESKLAESFRAQLRVFRIKQADEVFKLSNEKTGWANRG
jgi:hypothetical protein